ncbi:hypothetical protein EDC02_0686 [Micromonospora sp. Llam0]|uniref:hypothetical protein n=1 Tax=Micromonospora sp. Llam0 TaxID=2485143 RepID=UPI000FBBCB71|nr:hypothetical protein [Micromonospora sp. Llam0]ROO58915.1 hypothetical protein EDC02_0686 [Micromonospora sp. Llam0]
MYFSDYFGIENPDEHDWFDPTLERDTLLFVDPFLLFSDTEEKWRKSHDRLIEHFQDAFELLAQTGMNRQHQYYKRVLILMESKEPKEFRLGFATKKGVDGSGSGKWLASQIVEAMGEAIKRGLSEIEHFEELGILVEGIDKDRISDLTCNLLKPEFIEYTQHICHSLGIAMREVEVPHSKFDEGRRRWMSSTHLLPTDQKNKAIILVPKRFLRELPTLNGWDWVDEDSIRDDLNIDIARNIRKSDIVALARKNPQALRAWIRSKASSTVPDPYDVLHDPKLLVKWRRAATQALAAEPFTGFPPVRTEDDLIEFVRFGVEKFRHWAEEKGGWRVFWQDATYINAIPEPSMQLLFLAVIDSYCEMAGIQVDREVETGRGPVDFTFSGDRRMRVIVEMKRLTSGKFWHGLQTQWSSDSDARLHEQPTSTARHLPCRKRLRHAEHEKTLALHGE